MANDTYTTPNGVFQGQPDIAYPKTPGFEPSTPVPVGGVILAEGNIEYNTDRRTVSLKVRNTGDRPIQIGSHFHFFEVNRYLEFDRDAAFGKHRIIGFNDLTNGYAGYEDSPSYYPCKMKAFRKMQEYGFKNISEEEAEAEFTTPTPSNTKK